MFAAAKRRTLRDKKSAQRRLPCVLGVTGMAVSAQTATYGFLTALPEASLMSCQERMMISFTSCGMGT